MTSEPNPLPGGLRLRRAGMRLLTTLLVVQGLALAAEEKDKDKKKQEASHPAAKAEAKPEPRPEPKPAPKPQAPATAPMAQPVRPGGLQASPMAPGSQAFPNHPGPGAPAHMEPFHPSMVPPRPGEQHLPERQVVRTQDGGEIHRTPSGAIREVHTPGGAIIHHEPGGERRVEIVRPGGRVIVANGSGRSGFIQRPLVSHGHTFVQRTYVVDGAPRAALYRPWSHEGRDYAVYMPRHYYHPTFYVWVRTPWERPVAYNWGWRARPWYGYYGGYFTPYPSYASPAFWLTDFLIAATLESAYLAQNAGSVAPPPASVGSAGMTPEVKDAIAQEVGRQMERAKAEQANAQGGAPPSAPPPIFTADGPRIFLVSAGVLAYSGNQECPLTEGCVLSLVHTPAPGVEWAEVRVLATRGSGCPVGSFVSVRTTDLQEMENSLEASMEQGLNKLQTDPGGGIPAMPAQAVGTINASYTNDIVPDPGAPSELASAAEEADRSEQGLLNGSAQAPQASGATLKLGMTLAQVEAALGRPKSSVDLGAKQIYIYSDLKVTFMNGRVSDVQ